MGLELEAARQELQERVGYWQGQLDALFGGGVELEVDPVGLPSDPATLKRFGLQAFPALRDALADAAQDQRFTGFFKERVAKVLVRNDDAAAASRFDYERGRRKLVLICTPELRHWLDPIALQEFLRREL